MPISQSDIPVGEIMTSPAITIHPDATLAEAAQLMIDHKVGCLPIVDEEGRLIGLLTERSFFPSERKLPFTNQRMAWLLGEWVGDMHDLEETVAEVRNLRVADAEVHRRSAGGYAAGGRG